MKSPRKDTIQALKNEIPKKRDSFAPINRISEISISTKTLSFLSPVTSISSCQCEFLSAFHKLPPYFVPKIPEGDSESDSFPEESPPQPKLSVNTPDVLALPKILGKKSVSFSEKIEICAYDTSKTIKTQGIKSRQSVLSNFAPFYEDSSKAKLYDVDRN